MNRVQNTYELKYATKTQKTKIEGKKIFFSFTQTKDCISFKEIQKKKFPTRSLDEGTRREESFGVQEARMIEIR